MQSLISVPVVDAKPRRVVDPKMQSIHDDVVAVKTEGEGEDPTIAVRTARRERDLVAAFQLQKMKHSGAEYIGGRPVKVVQRSLEEMERRTAEFAKHMSSQP